MCDAAKSGVPNQCAQLGNARGELLVRVVDCNEVGVYINASFLDPRLGFQLQVDVVITNQATQLRMLTHGFFHLQYIITCSTIPKPQPSLCL